MNGDLRRVVWRYAPEPSGLFAAAPPGEETMAARAAPLLEGVQTVGGIEPMISGSRAALRAAGPSFEALEAEPELDVASYYQAYPVDKENAELLASRLDNDSDVDQVEVRSRPVRPYWYDPGPEDLALEEPLRPAAPAGFGASGTPTFFAYQRYLGPEGLQVHQAWTAPGGRGYGVHVLDVESYWNLRHEELAGRAQVAIGSPWGDDEARDHGTAVLGLISADDTGSGIIGLAPSSIPRAASIVWDPAPATGRWNVEAVLSQISALYPLGSVVLLELQERGPRTPGGDSQFGMLPVERWDSTWASIRRLVENGYYVVVAAGNGSQNLDDPLYRGRFSRRRDSGAILVGAGHSAFRTAPRSRCEFSNFGERLDVQAWGNDVTTSGGPLPHYRDLYPRHEPFDPWRCYTRSFGGTSSASALVAGAVACIAGAVRASGAPPLPPALLRNLLVTRGAPQRMPTAPAPPQKIGPLPRVGDCLRALGLMS